MIRINLTIKGEFPTLNQVVAASKTHYGAYSKMKKTHTQAVLMTAKGLPKVENKVVVSCTWYRKNRRSDPDNIASGIKFLLDGLVEAGVLKGDGWRHIESIHHYFDVDKENPRVEVQIIEGS